MNFKHHEHDWSPLGALAIEIGNVNDPCALVVSEVILLCTSNASLVQEHWKPIVRLAT